MRPLWLFVKANIFPYKMVFNFFRFSSKSEIIFDFLIPVLFPFIIILFIRNTEINTIELIKGIDVINKQSLTSISILAGFNVASISVLATSGSDLLKDLREKKSDIHKGVTLFEKIMTFFCTAIVLQFFIILIGIILLILLSLNADFGYTINDDPSRWMWFLLGFWVYLIIVSIFVSIRNLKTLFIIIVNGNDKGESGK